ncbi:MAG: hypothetical protein Kow0062_07440 [Acidobacteriota bacterium]
MSDRDRPPSAAKRADGPTRETVGRLHDEFGASTLGFFRRKVRNPALAEELNQELYLRLTTSLAGFRGECSERTWVFMIARAVLADARRRWWRHLADHEVQVDAAELAEAAITDTSPDDEAALVLLRKRLVRCLRRLDEIARAVVVGHYFHGITLRHLTERMRLPNASGSRAVLIAAQRKLRRCMTKGETL